MFRRHAVLRTYFAIDVQAGIFCQVVLPVDGSLVPLASSSSGEFRADVGRDLQTPFQLFGSPPLRAIRLSAQSSRLVVNVHHVASDMDALATMRSELVAHCAALAMHRPPPTLTPLAVEYADFALVQSDRSNSFLASPFPHALCQP
jgi:hypothetical protein